jgi:hypothetical protein
MRATASEPLFVFYAALGIGMTAAAAWWLRSLGRPLVFDRSTGEATGLARPVRLAEVAAVELRAEEASDSATGYTLFLRSLNGDVRVSRVGWSDETDPRAAERAGRALARFLGVEFHAPASVTAAT